MRQTGINPARQPMVESLENRRLLSAGLTGAFAGHLPRTLPVAGASQIAVHLTNSGTAKAVEPVTVQVFASTSPTPNSGEILLATKQQNVRLNPKGSVNARLTVPSPTTLPTGNYFLLAEVNGSVVATAPAQIQSPFSDLAVSFAGLPSQPVEIDGPSAGQRTATVDVVDVGNVPVKGRVNISFYLSADNTFDSGDALLATVANVPVALKPGGKKAVSIHIAVPPGTTAGGYFMLAQLTPGRAVADANPANNLAVSAGRLAVVNQLPRPTQASKSVNVTVSGGGGGGGDCGDGGGTVVAVDDGGGGSDGGDSSAVSDQDSSDNSDSSGDNSSGDNSSGGNSSGNNSSSNDSSGDDSSDNWDSGSDSSGGDF